MTAPRAIERADLIVAELPVVRHERAAVVVAGPDGPAESVERLPEAVVAQVGGVEDDSEPLHLRAAARVRFAPMPPEASVPCA